jgi:hypothetical protein
MSSMEGQKIFILSFISLAALLVKVTAMMLRGEILAFKRC